MLQYFVTFCSWASGANPWGPDKEDPFSKPTHHDGMLEIVGVTGVVHLGQIQSGLRNAVRIAQGGHVRPQPPTGFPYVLSLFIISKKTQTLV